MAEVMLDSVSKVYRSRRGSASALRTVSLRIADGELLAVVGPSGSGKSTLVRVIAGLEAPTEGRVMIGGEDVTDVPPHRRGVAMVPQSQALYPHMTVERNLVFGAGGGWRGGRAEAKERAHAAAEALGIMHLLRRLPGELSGGERQRAALAKAMARRPRVFLFDEPLSSLDVPLRAGARREIKTLHQKLGATMVHITHDQEEAMMLGDRIAVLRAGELQQVGKPEEVYGAPANVFVAGFIGSPGMNLIPGRVVEEGGGVWFVEEGGAGALRIPLKGAAARLAEFAGAGGDVVAGVRAGDLGLGSAAKDGVNAALTIQLVERLGQRADITGVLPSGRSLVVRVEGACACAPGEMLRVSFDPASMHFFEAGPSGRNLMTGAT